MREVRTGVGYALSSQWGKEIFVSSCARTPKSNDTYKRTTLKDNNFDLITKVVGTRFRPHSWLSVCINARKAGNQCRCFTQEASIAF